VKLIEAITNELRLVVWICGAICQTAIAYELHKAGRRRWKFMGSTLSALIFIGLTGHHILGWFEPSN
jgi:uncharacterized SAM-dependent methyltransferase